MNKISRVFSALAIIGTIVGGGLMLTACVPDDSTKQGQVVQEENMRAAIARIPVPTVRQFTTRTSIARWVENANQPDQTRYIYVTLQGVGILGYFVSDAPPVNICTSLTPPVREYRVGGGAGPNPLGPAPALDGVYYGGSGCNMYYFFDAATGEQVDIGAGVGFMSLSSPMAIDTPRLNIEVVTKKGK